MADANNPLTDNGSDYREAERTLLAPLTAKLVCQSGDYVCQLRDVSALGVGLTFLHPVPPEARIILQLSNERTYPIERVWIGKRQAGYRFACDVMLDEFTEVERDLRHRPIRLKVSASAAITDGRRSREVRLVDLSCEGARIECTEPLSHSGLIGFELAGMAPQLAEVRWQDGHEFGLTFQHQLMLSELAECALHLQPFGSSLPSGFAGLLSAARAAA